MTDRKTLVFALLMCSLVLPSAYGLVDYTDTDDAPSGSPKVTSKKRVSKARPSRNRRSSKGKFSKAMEFSTKYQSHSIKTNHGRTSGKADQMTLGAHFEAFRNVYLDLSYWQASSDDRQLVESDSFQKGNPEATIGLNWLQLDGVKMDLFAGGMMKTSNSDFGASRNDTIVGLKTSKQFENFLFYIIGEFRITGEPHDTSELQIGNITRLGAALGWVVSNDIRFALEAMTFSVRASNEESGKDQLASDISFSTLSPKLYLGVSPNVDIEMGANIRTKKSSSRENQDLLRAKLLDFSGSYGNSIFAGLNFSV